MNLHPPPGTHFSADELLRIRSETGFLILPDGRVTVCEELYGHPAFIIGDLKEQAVMEVWNSPAGAGGIS